MRFQLAFTQDALAHHTALVDADSLEAAQAVGRAAAGKHGLVEDHLLDIHYGAMGDCTLLDNCEFEGATTLPTSESEDVPSADTSALPTAAESAGRGTSTPRAFHPPRLWLYRVLTLDEDGDPLDHGVLRADTHAEVIHALEVRCREIELSGPERVVIRLYSLDDRPDAGVLDTRENFTDVTVVLPDDTLSSAVDDGDREARTDSPATGDLDRGAFTPRVPEAIHAVRWDGSPEAKAAILALFPDDHVHPIATPAVLQPRERACGPDGLWLEFPDGRIGVRYGDWVWREAHGYDVVPATVMSNRQFLATYQRLLA